MRTFLIRASMLLALLAALTARADAPTTQPFAGVQYAHETRTDPPMNLYVVQVDLTNPNVSLRISPAGKDPDGDGEWQTVLQPPSEIAARENFDLCVNASFFSARDTKDVEGAKSGFVAGKWASAVGLAMTDGKLWSSKPMKSWPMFYLDKSHAAHLVETGSLPADAIEAVQGNAMVLRNGDVVDPKSQVMKAKHPRTAIGLDASGKTLTILTVDGRRPGVSVGMTGSELGDEMKRLGCADAMNLDGGGSTELVLRDPQTGALKVMNHPSDGRERAVADVLGISVRGAKRAE